MLCVFQLPTVIEKTHAYTLYTVCTDYSLQLLQFGFSLLKISSDIIVYYKNHNFTSTLAVSAITSFFISLFVCKPLIYVVPRANLQAAREVLLFS